MNYLIFGAGETGKKALEFLRPNRVEAFVETNPVQDLYEGKEIIPLLDVLKKGKGEYIVVVASRRYAVDMAEELKNSGVENYFVFAESDIWDYRYFYPGYFLYRRWIIVSYTEVLLRNEVSRYQKIVIYGENYFLPYLIAEVAFQVGIDKVIGICGEGENFRNRRLGIQTISLDEAIRIADCLIVNKRRDEDPIFQIIDDGEITLDIIEIYDVERFEPAFCHPELIKYKDSHKNERCFVIGNGPSLTIEDLDCLYENGEFCFAFNKIYKIYGQTKWRANVLGIVDPLTLKGSEDDIPNLKGIVIISDEWNRSYEKIFENAEYYHNYTETYYPNYPRFSDDMTRGMYRGFSSVYNIGLQMAAYMGFSEIYLLGVDHNNFGDVTHPQNHFIPDYYNEKEREMRAKSSDHFYEEEITMAYQKAELYSRKNGFRIFNATRGGRLEVFERVEFETLF